MSSKVVLSTMVALLVLTACASPGELRQGRPDIAEVTTFPPERVAGCIGDKLEAWSGASRTRLSTRPTINLVTVFQGIKLWEGKPIPLSLSTSVSSIAKHMFSFSLTSSVG